MKNAYRRLLLDKAMKYPDKNVKFFYVIGLKNTSPEYRYSILENILKYCKRS